MIELRKYPKTGSVSAEKHYYYDLELRNLTMWIIHMAGTMDRMGRIARKALGEEISVDDIDGGLMVKELSKNRTILMHMLHVRNVDNYLNYLSDILIYAKE